MDNFKKNALKNLPQYTAPNRVWHHIEQKLHLDAPALAMNQQLKQLPQYEAPARVWKNIANRLPQHSRKTISMKQALSLAAGIFLLAAGWIVAEHFASPRIIITEEIQRPDLQIAVTSGDASAFRLVTQICQTKPFLCENYEVQLLQRELEELNRACQTLQREIHGVNTQPHLVATLTDLEMQRTEILKQLIALI